MTRLFITLYLLLAAALASYWFIADSVPQYFLEKIGLNYAHENYRGTRHLLEQRIQGLAGKDLEGEVAEIQRMFEYPIDLVEENTLELDPEQKAILTEDKLVEREVDGADQGIYRSEKEGMAWIFDSDQTNSEHNRRISIGTFRMVEALLLEHTAANRPTALSLLNVEFGFPVILEHLNDVQLEREQKEQLSAGEVIGVNINTDDERYYYLSQLPLTVGDSARAVIRFGPIQFPISVPLIVTALLSLLALLVALAVWIWIKPIWQGMTSLTTATKRFGEGDFSARVQYGKKSGIREIGSAFNQMAERIQNLLGSHRELTNAVSHELRTPLSRMRFSMEMLNNADSDPDRQRHLSNMSADIDELDGLVTELLTYARFDRDPGSVKAEKVHLPSWLGPEVKRLESQLNRRLTLVVEQGQASAPMLVWAEPRLLSRAISNLVHNAARYAKSEIVVRLSCSNSNSNSNITISVEDDGPGIPVADRERIFDPFSRLDQSRNRESGGVGLGLSIVKQIAEWHHGDVSVEAAENGGALFLFVLPPLLLGSSGSPVSTR
ncbi:MAG: HAMP domain-containing protein [Gammaproteobacteria bacterium]|nr:HAMP domain-containing protein [Gammaproteobacteria bacterium]